MKLSLFAAGKARKGPEFELTDRYIVRINNSGAQVGLGPISISEYDPNSTPKGVFAALECNRTAVCILDENGHIETSRSFARILANWRDEGRRECTFLIGGADGTEPEMNAQADRQISFGRMTFPHMLVRILLAEQIYRAVSILRGDPYHRN